MDKERLKQKVNRTAQGVNALRTQLSHAVRNEEYEQAAVLRDEANALQRRLILLIHKK